MSISTNRYGFIDLLRGWAVIVMIEVHVVNAFLNPIYRTGSWFETLNFINGLVAPSFLFLAGFSFTVMLERKREEFIYFSKTFKKTLLKFLAILTVGYLLRIPYYSYNRLNYDVSEQLMSNFLKVDILHCISVTLIILLFAAYFIKNKKVYNYLLILLFVLFYGLTNYLWNTDVHKNIPTIFANYLNISGGSLFPLFPWSAFLILGSIVSSLWLKYRDLFERKFFCILFIIGMVFAVSGILYQIYFQANSDVLYWQISPIFFTSRLGFVFLLLSIMWIWEVKFGPKKSAILISGTESLVLYVLHLLIIYGMFFEQKSLAFIIKKTLQPNEAIVFSVILIIAMVAAGLIWNKIKKESARYSNIIKLIIVVVLLYYFFTN